jgi:hypothetical protein
MSFLDEAEYPKDEPAAQTLLAILEAAYADKEPAKIFLSSVSISEREIFWDQAMHFVWLEILQAAARKGMLRDLVLRARADPSIQGSRGQLDQVLAASPQDEAVDGDDPNHFMAKFVGPRPFVNRLELRKDLKRLVGDDGEQVMIVDGPPLSGRSYAWFLIAHVARKTRSFDPHLIDLTKWTDTQARPIDVANLISIELGWDLPDAVDRTAQYETTSRTLLTWIKGRTRDHPPVCLVFDGLDGANVADATVRFIGDIATAAGNAELNSFRVVLLAFGRPLGDPGVDAIALRGQPLSAIELSELTEWFQEVAKDGGISLSAEQATTLAATLLGSPPPDPVPIAALRSTAREVAQVARNLREGNYV